MSRNPTFDRIAAIIARQAHCAAQDVTPGARWNDLHIDDLGYVAIVMAVEKEFDLRIPEDQSEFVSTVGELASLVFDRQKKVA